MGKNVLIATLGESPIIVTSMVKALQEKAQINIDRVDVIHPEGEKLIAPGCALIEDHLKGQCCVNSWPLGFPDANSRETSMAFFRILSGLIESHEHAENSVYLSLAGGRKNMSALMAVTCQFFECVRGLYHILDKYEDDPDPRKRNFHSIETLFDNGEEERKGKLSPPADNLILVEIPYPSLSNGIALRRYFRQDERGITAPITMEGELDAFYGEIFNANLETTELLDVWLSKEAYEFYQDNPGDASKRKRLKNCFRAMRYPQALEQHIHTFANDQSKTDCKCFKMGNTDERLFYYRTDSRIIIADIVRHGRGYNRIIKGARELYSKDHLDHIRSNELEEDGILIAPLGKSPMVVTQTFALLSEREEVKIEKVIVVHPSNSEISNGVNVLKEAFREKLCLHSSSDFFQSVEIDDITDVACNDDCKTYITKLGSVIQEVRHKHPQKSIYLSLSGGRKGMAALTLFAAQAANIDAVYHTLITDVELEEKIEEQTTMEKLKKLDSAGKIRRLFLGDYNKLKFELFRVPVIPISGSTT